MRNKDAHVIHTFRDPSHDLVELLLINDTLNAVHLTIITPPPTEPSSVNSDREQPDNDP